MHPKKSRVTQKPFRMAEGSLSSFAAIKLIYVKLTVILLKIKKITVVLWQMFIIFKVQNKKIINHLPYEYKDNI